MTDIASEEAAPAMRHAPDLSTARLRKRYAAEFRFKLYGIAAILAAVAMLSILMISIVGKGLPAFFQHEIALEVTLPQEEIDPQGTADPEVIGQASFRSLLRDAIYEQFPGVSGRTERRALAGLFSGGAELSLRAAVMEDSSLIGARQRFVFLTSDDADVYYKGQVADLRVTSPGGSATPTGVEGEIAIVTTANGFSDILLTVKQVLGGLVDELQRDLIRAQRGVAAARSALESAQGALGAARSGGASADNIAILEASAAAAEASLASGETKAEDLEARIADLAERAGAPGGTEALTANVPSYLMRINGGLVKLTSISSSEAVGEVILPLESAEEAGSGEWELVNILVPEDERRLSDFEIALLEEMKRRGMVERAISSAFFTKGDSREPEQAGIWGAVLGSFFTLMVTLALSFPVGVLTAVYLEEFAPKNRLTDLIEVNINNLAAVPSIVFGLLGLAVFLNFFGLPRSAPLVGGMVLALMTLPTIIIAARAALKAVPPSIREAAYGVGASKLQVMTHHVLPLAMPGILTGTIIGMAQALGETAPLLMIGMVAFIVDVPGGFTDPATVLPVQIYIWADSPERAFVAKTSAAIMVLLAFLIFMNALAVLLRRRFERRW